MVFFLLDDMIWLLWILKKSVWHCFEKKCRMATLTWMGIRKLEVRPVEAVS